MAYYLNDEQIKQINMEVALVNQEYTPTAPGILREEIFKLLEKVGTLIFYPINEKDLWGVYVCRNEKHYFIINSSIELEKQVFAGAHELAHSILDIAKAKFEIVTADLMTEYVNHTEYGPEIEKADAIANRFAAELLVGKKKLEEKYKELPPSYSSLVKAVILSDIFLVPYKTIIKRFVETELITDTNEITNLLEVKCEQIENIAERYECCRRNYEITEATYLGGYINKALMLYENELSTYKELESALSLIQKSPEDFGIESFDINEFLRRASECSEVEEDDGED